MDPGHSGSTQGFNDAPEVIRGHSDLIAAESSPSSYTGSSDPSSSEKAPELSQHYSKSTRHRRRWIWILAGVILLILAVGLGTGLGLSLASRHESNPGPAAASSEVNTIIAHSETPSSTSISSITASTNSPTTPAAPRVAVTSGNTGLAQYDCDNASTFQSSAGTAFIEECNTRYRNGVLSFYDPAITINSIYSRAVYTFLDCIDECDRWNDGTGTPECRAVTYFANLTDTFISLGWKTNCFLKNDRAVADTGGGVGYQHTMSAWMGCLNVTCFGT